MQSVLSYYAGLLQLLGYCCHGQQSTSVKEMSLEQSSILDRTRHILKNLVSLNDVTSLLLVPFDPNGRPLMLPLYKKASLHFVERVYGLHDPDHTLKLLTESFLPDIKLALQFLHVSICLCVCMWVLSVCVHVGVACVCAYGCCLCVCMCVLSVCVHMGVACVCAYGCCLCVCMWVLWCM